MSEQELIQELSNRAKVEGPGSLASLLNAAARRLEALEERVALLEERVAIMEEGCP